MSNFEKIMEARKQIVSFSEGKLNTSGKIEPCPICKKESLYFEVHGNGHIWAKCQNKIPCVSWME